MLRVSVFSTAPREKRNAETEEKGTRRKGKGFRGPGPSVFHRTQDNDRERGEETIGGER